MIFDPKSLNWFSGFELTYSSTPQADESISEMFNDMIYLYKHDQDQALSLSQVLFQISGGVWMSLRDSVRNEWTVPSCCTDGCCWSSRLNHRSCWEVESLQVSRNTTVSCEAARYGCSTFRWITWCGSPDQIRSDLCCLKRLQQEVR